MMVNTGKAMRIMTQGRILMMIKIRSMIILKIENNDDGDKSTYDVNTKTLMIFK